jgi:hypothetical protein
MMRHVVSLSCRVLVLTGCGAKQASGIPAGRLMFWPSVQWDGTHMTVSSASNSGEHAKGSPIVVYRLQISGSAATVIGTTRLISKKNHLSGQSWIQGKKIISLDSYGGDAKVWSWPYPKGGNGSNLHISVRAPEGESLWGVTVSKAPL